MKEFVIGEDFLELKIDLNHPFSSQDACYDYLFSLKMKLYIIVYSCKNSNSYNQKYHCS